MKRHTSCRNVGCYEDFLFAIAEALDNRSPLFNSQFTGEQRHCMAIFCHLFCQPQGCPSRLLNEKYQMSDVIWQLIFKWIVHCPVELKYSTVDKSLFLVVKILEPYVYNFLYQSKKQQIRAVDSSRWLETSQFKSAILRLETWPNGLETCSFWLDSRLAASDLESESQAKQSCYNRFQYFNKI